MSSWTREDRLNYAHMLIVKAWTDEGVSPWYHRQVKKWLKRKWPLLYNAIEDLVWNWTEKN